MGSEKDAGAGSPPDRLRREAKVKWIKQAYEASRYPPSNVDTSLVAEAMLRRWVRSPSGKGRYDSRMNP